MCQLGFGNLNKKHNFIKENTVVSTKSTEKRENLILTQDPSTRQRLIIELSLIEISEKTVECMKDMKFLCT